MEDKRRDGRRDKRFTCGQTPKKRPGPGEEEVAHRAAREVERGVRRGLARAVVREEDLSVKVDEKGADDLRGIACRRE